MPASGGPRQKTADCEVNGWYQLAYSPVGDALAVAKTYSTDRAVGLRQLSLKSGELTTLTSPPDGYLGDTKPAFSADGRWLAFARAEAEGIEDLYLQEIGKADVKARRLTSDQRQISGLAFSISGRQLFFTSNRGGRFHLWRLDVNGGTPESVPTSGHNITGLALSPDGRRLIYEEWASDVNIWEMRSLAGNRLLYSRAERSESDLWLIRDFPNHPTHIGRK